MFLKRFYNSLRFWQAIITQLILPLLFVLFGLVLAVTLPNANENDPSRQLRIDNSVLDPDNRILFYAEFGNGPRGVFDFKVSATFISVQSNVYVKMVTLLQAIFSDIWGGA